ncbi:predicted protein, partial [Nematostella vectensis]
LLIAAYCFIMPIALIGNVFVVRTIFKVPRMKTPTNMMFVNMALFDIIVAVTMMPYMISFILYPFRWLGGLFGTITCKLTYYAFYISIAGSILALTVMATDRFFAIVLPFKKVRFFKRFKLLTCIVWVTSMLYMLPIAVLQEVKLINGDFQCATNWFKLADPLLSFKAFSLCVLVSFYLIPLAVMAVLYALIAHRLWFSRIPVENAQDETNRRIQNKKRKVVRMLVIILVVFALCWLPAHIGHFMLIINDSPTEVLVMFGFFLGHANSAINPCLYVILHSGFRRAFLQLF